MKKILFIVLILGIVGGGVYYWNWQTLHHTIVISEPTAVSSPETDRIENIVPIPKGWINILVLGVDYKENEVARSDSIMLVLANADTHKISVISIPRDSRVNLPGVGLTKINHANAVGEIKGGVHEGTLESAKAVSDFLGVSINYYIKLNFQGFQKAVDAVGGIDVNLPNRIDDDLRDVHLSAGEHHLDGDLSARLSRARFGLPNGDADRQKDQYYLFSALAHQMLTLSNIPKLPGELDVVRRDLMDTNLSTSEMVAIGIAFKGIEKETIKYYQLPGRAIIARDPLVGADVYYYEPDMDGVKKVVQEALK